jgi:hypothetical protein
MKIDISEEMETLRMLDAEKKVLQTIALAMGSIWMAVVFVAALKILFP